MIKHKSKREYCQNLPQHFADFEVLRKIWTQPLLSEINWFWGREYTYLSKQDPLLIHGNRYMSEQRWVVPLRAQGRRPNTGYEGETERPGATGRAGKLVLAARPSFVKLHQLC
ncbi:hypothetical protein PAHAL_7G084800 [Panicum hallii]|uniref:Uncharacterized protein n=1 Tax=Panicum hallii TaxID=206008 RepID=A0A2T8IBJ3_9POAL|nr:hypothetical protein PAHAL_7G084800 [Panicum hallii]